ncbi:MAG: hypothetical protein HYY61_04095 [Deltaproteobacteria bacterium]|nr:hypothetical protein [Deltaproteobacteria bacterium]
MKKKKKAKMTKKHSSYKYNPNEWDESKSVEVTPEPRIKAGISTSIRLPHPMVIQLKKVAKKKGDIGYQTLLKIWIAERLEKEAEG